jgi:hypothetical protein
MAAQIDDLVAKQAMLTIAESYDRIAERAAARALRPNPPVEETRPDGDEPGFSQRRADADGEERRVEEESPRHRLRFNPR